MTTRVYLSNDTSARAAGADQLAEAWSLDSEIQITRTSSRGDPRTTTPKCSMTPSKERKWAPSLCWLWLWESSSG
jgi:hypothetical protein